MKHAVAKHGRWIGGLFALATAGLMYWDYKVCGAITAAIGIALAVASEHFRPH